VTGDSKQRMRQGDHKETPTQLTFHFFSYDRANTFSQTNILKLQLGLIVSNEYLHKIDILPGVILP
jgi:hypothetical protein